MLNTSGLSMLRHARVVIAKNHDPRGRRQDHIMPSMIALSVALGRIASVDLVRSGW